MQTFARFTLNRSWVTFSLLAAVSLLTLVPQLCHADFDRYDLQIPVPPNTWLAADLYMPDSATVAMPVVLVQTPYNKNKFRLRGPPLDTEAFAFVIMDWRGKHGSSHADIPFPKYGEDGALAIEWIASRDWCNGKVAMYGGSALAQVQWLTAKEQPDHLVCMVPINHAIQTRYQKYYHGGVKRTEYVETLSGWEWIPTLVNNHPTYDTFWQWISWKTNNAQDIQVPVLLVSGWWDMTPDEALITFNDLVDTAPDSIRDSHKLLIGPWTHTTVGRPQQGSFLYPAATGELGEMATKFLLHHLRDVGEDNEPAVRYFDLGPDTFRTADSWPPEGGEHYPFYITDEGLRTYQSGNGVEGFPYNPRMPIATEGGRLFKKTLNPGPHDIAELTQRGDVLYFDTPMMTESVEIAGYIHANLYVSTNRPDTDFMVFLADVYPNGTARFITDGARRIRFRNNFSTEELAEPGQVYELDIPMQSMALTIEPAHRLRLYITSSNYPRFDLNLNNGGEMYAPGDTLIAFNSVHYSTAHPSALWLPIHLSNSQSADVLNGGTSSQVRNGQGTELAVDESSSLLPDEFVVNAYPNPFNDAATVSVALPQAGQLTLKLYNVTGQEVATLTDATHPAGRHEFSFQASNLASGLYFLRAIVPGQTEQVRKLMLVR